MLVFAACLGCSGASAQEAAQTLRSGFAAARERSTQDIFNRPLYLQSSETADRLQGEVYALIDFPYPVVRRVLERAERWCGILILHLNVQYCRASGTPALATLDTGFGRTFDQPLSQAYWVSFDYAVADSADDHLGIVLKAATGPLGTTDYRIEVEVLPYADRRSLLHLTYAYSYGAAAHVAMQVYLATIGSHKVGFSSVGTQADGASVLVGGVRGVVERNTLRYFLAIESYVGAESSPAPLRQMKRLQDWFTATERYARQLHEVEREAYIDMKLGQIKRQETEAPPLRQR